MTIFDAFPIRDLAIMTRAASGSGTTYEGQALVGRVTRPDPNLHRCLVVLNIRSFTLQLLANSHIAP
jgi:hypothetical protein